MSRARFLVPILIFTVIQIHAQSGIDSLSRKNYTLKYEAGAEYLIPTRFSNQIKTTSFHCFFWKKRFKDNYVLVSIGITGTYAWGYSKQYKIIPDSFPEADRYKTSAFGIGPVIQIDPTIIKIKRFAIIAEASGGLLLYSNRFPYGADIYNFMFRTGPSITYQTSKNYFFKIGYRWMHVSNGKGFGNQNPFYEAQGVNISFIKKL